MNARNRITALAQPVQLALEHVRAARDRPRWRNVQHYGVGPAFAHPRLFDQIQQRERERSGFWYWRRTFASRGRVEKVRAFFSLVAQDQNSVRCTVHIRSGHGSKQLGRDDEAIIESFRQTVRPVKIDRLTDEGRLIIK